MAEQIISPGVFTSENDLSFLPAGIGAIGAAIVGPTVKGTAGIPTLVTSYAEFVDKFGNTFQSGSNYYQYLTSHAAERYLQFGGALTVVRLDGSGAAAASASVVTGSKIVGVGGHQYTTGSAGQQGGSTTDMCIKLHTLGTGVVYNSGLPHADAGNNNNILTDGTTNNLRYEIAATSSTDGTFTLLIRRGDDDINNKVILETFNNCSLDPKASNYVAKVVGDQYFEVDESDSSDPFVKTNGDYPNKSAYVRVEVIQQTVDYLDANGEVRVGAASASLPALGSGSFAGAQTGSRLTAAHNFYENISTGNCQGFDLNDLTNIKGGAKFNTAMNLLANQDYYDINMIIAPGINQTDHGPAVDKVIKTCESRGDAIAIVDPTPHGASIASAVDEANDYNSSYAAMYWPWVQVTDNQLGTNRWVPPSVVMPGIMAYSDEVAAEWYAPAGLNRGGIVAHKAERNLTHKNRDTLYNGRINPIATFPGVGVCAWGQKTLQKRASALDRINVRRLLINLKKFIASTSKYLVFENNTNATRNKFLATVVPYMESVQANQGLYAFRVVMDTTNNTPDVIDRNIMKGDIFIQPARAAEFIVVDFNIMPTGATFND